MEHSSTGLSLSFAQAETAPIDSDVCQQAVAELTTLLLDSDVCQQAIAELTTLTGEALETAQNLFKLVGREAMRLAVQQIAQQSPATVEARVPEPESGEEVRKADRPSLALPKFVTKLPKAQQEEQLRQEREEQCRYIGRTLRSARQAKGMSRQQLHARTLVPLYQIQALEDGCLEKLPEDVYLRGFIRQLANALELDGPALVRSLSEATTSVVPSWYRDRASGGKVLPLHLYAGYTAVVAGAIGGMSWMSHHNAMTASVDEIDAGSDRQTTLSPKHSSQSHDAQAAAQAATSIAPPETMSN